MKKLLLLLLPLLFLTGCGGGDDDGRRLGDHIVGTWQRGWEEGDVVIEGDTEWRPEDFSYDLFVFRDDGNYNGMVRNGSFAAYDIFGDIIYEGNYRCDNNNLKLEFKDEEGIKRTILALDDAMELFKLPREIGEYEGKPVTIGTGRFGPYVLHDHKYTSLPKDTDPMAVTLDEAISLIQEKRQQDSQKHIKFFLEDPKLEVMNGRYGPYLSYDGKNYRLPKNLHEKAKELTFDECIKIIQATPAKKES